MSNKQSTDFRFLITLSNVTGKMARGELERRGVPVKTMSAGTNVSWNVLRAGADSPEIFMPGNPLDIYVPENRIKESKEVIESFGWDQEKIEIPKARVWQKIWAVIILILFLIIFISTIIMLLKNFSGN
jgi:hypothetical protein